MKKRFQLPLFALVFLAVSGAHGQSIFTWSSNSADGLLSNPANWSGGSLPTSDGNAQLRFGSTNRSLILLDASPLQIHSLAFTGSYNSYHFASPDGADLIIGTGGVSVPASGNATVVSDSSIFIGLAGDQTWDIGGHLTVRGMISNVPDFTSALTKSGTGTLRLEAENNFSGLRVEAGTLEISTSSQHEGGFIYVSPVGLGDLTLADNTTLRSTGQDVQLHNNIVLGNHVTLDSGDFDSLQLAGTVTAGNANTTIKVAGEQPVLFTSTVDGAADTNLTFTSPTGRFGGAGFADVFSDNIKTLTADRAALLFFADVPETITLHATNNGYISAAAAPEETGLPAPSPAALLARIASPSTFAGTFGFDTHPDSDLLHNYTDNLDFSAFTHPQFRIGSHSDAIISGTIKPVEFGSTALYPFGGSSGHLVVSSNLADAPGKPTSILVSSAPHEHLYVLLRGNNTTSGTIDFFGRSGHLAVERSIVVLDSAGALPGGANGTFVFQQGTPSYIGATEAAFPTFAEFVSHLAPNGYSSYSVLGLDSHDAFEAMLEHGVDTNNFAPRSIGETIDLRNLQSIYLGTASDVILAGTVHAPAGGRLDLVAVDDGKLTVAAPFGADVNSVHVGLWVGLAGAEFGDGTIEMRAQQTYGDTTLYSGTLSIATSSILDSDHHFVSGPIGGGALNVQLGVSDPILRAQNHFQVLHNRINLSGDLQIGRNTWSGEDLIPDFNQLSLTGDISGSGGLNIRGNVQLLGNNTYTGGTRLSSSTIYLGSDNAIGTGLLEIRGHPYFAAGLAGYGDITLSNSINLGGSLSTTISGGTLTLDGNILLAEPTTLSNYGNTRITGPISGPGSLTINKWDPDPLWISVKAPVTLSNTYEGGTRVNAGSVIFGNASSIPLNGRLVAGSSGYIGAAFNTNVQADFLNRFDKPGTIGAFGFDTADINTPIVIAEDLNLSSFDLNARLGTATAATLTGNILPAGDTSSPYQFGSGGGILTVSSNLGSGRSISVVSFTGAPLTLVLTGDNRGANGLVSSGSIVRFDGAHALPSTGGLVASNYGYIGYTEQTGLSPAAFLSRWSSAWDIAIIGFDSHSNASPQTISDPISIATWPFNSDTYFGTSTNINLNGTLTPFGTSLNLTGVGTGNLIVNSTITSPHVTTLVVGTPYPWISGAGTVTLNSANTYTGGTDLFSSHLILGHASALGTGPLRIGAYYSRISVSPQAAGATIVNAVDTGDTSEFGHKLTLDATNPFTLSGNISGEGSLDKTGTGTVTLSGDNSNLSGEIDIHSGKLVFGGNTSAGTGSLNFWAEAGIAEFLGNAPSIGGLRSSYSDSRVDLAANSILTVNVPESEYPENHYAGSINGPGASVVYTAPSAINGTTIQLSGASTYTGGTTINSGVTVVANHNNALGTTGTITVNGGSLSTGSGVTLASTATRPIVFTAGAIGGSGTISFHSSLVVTNQLALTPGNSVGKLTLEFDSAAALVFNSGGTYRWELADATGSAGTGWDFIHVAGNVDIAALAAVNDTFNITLHTIDDTRGAGYAANFNPDASYSWAILTATSITNFDPAKFNLFADSTTFLNATAGGTFSLSLENNTLLLNFTPVPEPSTWALMITGLAAVIVTTLRRRRS